MRRCCQGSSAARTRAGSWRRCKRRRRGRMRRQQPRSAPIAADGSQGSPCHTCRGNGHVGNRRRHAPRKITITTHAMFCPPAPRALHARNREHGAVVQDRDADEREHRKREGLRDLLEATATRCAHLGAHRGAAREARLPAVEAITRGQRCSNPRVVISTGTKCNQIKYARMLACAKKHTKMIT